MTVAITKDVAIKRIAEILPSHTTIDADTYVAFTSKAKFIDSEFGEFWITPKNICKGMKHRARAYAERRIAHKLSAEQIAAQLPPYISLDISTYKDTHTKARFIDSEYGEFWVKPNFIRMGGNHKKRSKVSAAKSHTYNLDIVKSKIPKGIELKTETYVNTSTPCVFIDCQYGEFISRPADIFKGHGHPQRGLDGFVIPLEEIQKKILEYSKGIITIIAETYKKATEPAIFIDSKYGEFTARPSDLIRHQRYHPSRFSSTSKAEQEISDWVLSLGLTPEKKRITDNKGRFEIDIFIKELNIGIEYCGLYWHSEDVINQRQNNIDGIGYHYNKMKRANSQGIRLITIFEDEWRDRKEQVKSFLLSSLNKPNVKIFARNCKVVEISKEQSSALLDANHIQGKCSSSSLQLGLYHKEVLVGVMTGGKHHRSQNNETIVLDRLCFLTGYQVVGGSSKLLAAFIEKAKSFGFKSVISWSDNRWSEGNVYRSLGFILDGELKPDYSYVKWINRFSKQSKKKTQAEKLLGKTEKELRLEQGFLRIWDCGKKRWRLAL